MTAADAVVDTATDTTAWMGRPLDRIDGPRKVAGAAPYSSDIQRPGMVHAALVTATVAAGRITAIDASQALAAEGVIDVLSHENFPRLAPGPQVPFGWTPPAPLQTDRVDFHGQEVAVVVADTPEQATEAARLVRVEYEQDAPQLDPEAAAPQPSPYVPDVSRGDVTAGWAEGSARIDARYSTPENANNPLGLMGTVAAWRGDELDVYDSTQWPTLVQRTMAEMFGVAESAVRVRVPFLGGGFGAGLISWAYKVIAVAAARAVGRPVRLMLTRPQMFTQVGHRPNSTHHVKLAAAADGRLTAIEHRASSLGAINRPALGLLTVATTQVYACPNVATSESTVPLNRRYPSAMRGPGEAEGNFALEVALDELAVELDLDPLELRLRNHSEHHPHSGLPWSSNALAECYRVGAQRFGWSARDPRPGSMRAGDELIGWGMATASYGGYQLPCAVDVGVRADGTASVRSAATDIGTGTYTVITQVAADLLGLPVERVDFDLGDTAMPPAPQSGGSALATSLSAAVHSAVQTLRQAIADLELADADSPLHGLAPDQIELADGGVRHRDDPSVRQSYVDLLHRHGRDELHVVGEAAAAAPAELGMAQAGAFGARFAEVRIDPLIGRLRVSRLISVTDGGRVLNQKLARSQIIGGTVGGIGMALFEDVATDPDTGRVANATLADYLIPVNADIPELDVTFVGRPDRFTPTGVKGVGEIGLVGVPAAIANAVHHATGRRFRDLPITIDKLLM